MSARLASGPMPRRRRVVRDTLMRKVRPQSSSLFYFRPTGAVSPGRKEGRKEHTSASASHFEWQMYVEDERVVSNWHFTEVMLF